MATSNHFIKKTFSYRTLLLAILQWNCRSIYPKLLELEHFLLLSALPDIFCLQETFLNCRQKLFVSGYQLIRKDRAISLGREGDMCTSIKTDKQFNKLTKFDNLEKGNEVIGIQVSGITLIKLYNSRTKHLFKN